MQIKKSGNVQRVIKAGVVSVDQGYLGQIMSHEGIAINAEIVKANLCTGEIEFFAKDDNGDYVIEEYEDGKSLAMVKAKIPTPITFVWSAKALKTFRNRRKRKRR